MGTQTTNHDIIKSDENTTIEILKIGSQGGEIWGMDFLLTHLSFSSLFVIDKLVK